MTDHKLHIVKDVPNRKLNMTRYFDVAPELVWRAWTESDLLDQWWAPKPWKAETKSMSFRDGGHWQYAMVGPDHQRHWSKVTFSDIKAGKSFRAFSVFCDENGVTTDAMPSMQWTNEFRASGGGTNVVMEILFPRDADIKTILEMGFEGGFSMALGNLDDYFSAQFKIRKELKTGNKVRVATYLNFPGNTEDAFNFYRNVFGGEFTGGGLQRFGDVNLPAGGPPLSDADKKLILHAELTILGGHVLMATDAPESMGFKMEYGNNMHITLEPESREETRRLFDALSEGGKVTMPLEDMFFGAYFGSITDKYGINWMLNFQAEKI